jgi:hypothetical protein
LRVLVFDILVAALRLFVSFIIAVVFIVFFIFFIFFLSS